MVRRRACLRSPGSALGSGRHKLRPHEALMRFRRFPSIVIAVLAAFSMLFASAQDDASVAGERRVRDLADLALGAPPELAADVLLKLVERGRIKHPKWKRELLETAWSLAPRAAYAFEVDPA